MGGFIPFAASALVVRFSDIFAGLCYPVVIACATVLLALIFLRQTKGSMLHKEGASCAPTLPISLAN